MPSREAHLRTATRNEAALQYLLLKLTDHTEWIAVVAFYKAVHLVEAMFAGDPKIRHTWDHRARREALKADPKYVNVFKHYAPLVRTSMIARYLCESRRGTRQYASFTDYMSAEQVQTEVVNYRLRGLERAITDLRGSHA